MKLNIRGLYICLIILSIFLVAAVTVYADANATLTVNPNEIKPGESVVIKIENTGDTPYTTRLTVIRPDNTVDQNPFEAGGQIVEYTYPGGFGDTSASGTYKVKVELVDPRNPNNVLKILQSKFEVKALRVPQNLSLYDTGIDNLVTNATDQSVCRFCHQTAGTNISGGYNNTIGGVPTRHHLLVQRGMINPYTNAIFGCNDCHPSTPGVGNGILMDRSCVMCHNGTAFYANSIGGRVGNFSRPHHVNTSYASSKIGNPAANRTCNFCHGSFINNYNDQHYKPSYATDFMITPFATFKVTNFSQPDGLGGNKTWGGCLSCHLPDPNVTPVIGSNHDNHHKEINGLGRFGGQTQYQNASTPGAACSWCHVIAPGTTHPLRINKTNDFTGELLTNAMEVRNSTIEATDVFEPGTTNISINGTGCEKCHDVKSLHNIQYQYEQNGPEGKGHINNNSDCSGCHDSWIPANSFVPGALIPSVDNVEPSVLVAETAVTLTITGNNFVNDPYTSNVTVDGVTYYPTSVTNTEIVVDIPGLTTGTHQLQIIKGGDTLSKLYVLEVVPAAHITSATVSKGVITISGAGFGARPATNAQYYVSINHAGNQIVSAAITQWTNTQIKAKNSAAAVGDTVTVITADSGETTATIT